MPKFPNSLQAWGTDDFPRTLKNEIETMDTGILPLQAATTRGGLVDDADITAVVLKSTEEGQFIHVGVGIFFTEITAACSCGEEPDAINGYCQLQVHIDKSSAEAEFHVAPA